VLPFTSTANVPLKALPASTLRQRLLRARDELINGEQVGVTGERCWIISATSRYMPHYVALCSATIFKSVANWEHVMLKATGVAVGSLILLTAMVRTCGAAEQQFSCKGQIIDEGTDPSAQSKPIDLYVTFGGQEHAFCQN
jgi:hypothetical protein